MTRKGLHPCDESVLKRLARLMQLHQLTNPERIARRYGFSAEYVRRQWRELGAADMESVARRVEAWIDE